MATTPELFEQLNKLRKEQYDLQVLNLIQVLVPALSFLIFFLVGGTLAYTAVGDAALVITIVLFKTSVYLGILAVAVEFWRQPRIIGARNAILIIETSHAYEKAIETFGAELAGSPLPTPNERFHAFITNQGKSKPTPETTKG